jgi:hypothetical protein
VKLGSSVGKHHFRRGPWFTNQPSDARQLKFIEGERIGIIDQRDVTAKGERRISEVDAAAS